MTTGKLISQDEKLRQSIARVLADIIIDQSASNADIASGIYKPINKNFNLINFKELAVVPIGQADAGFFSNFSSDTQNKERMKNIFWESLVSNHIGKMLFIALMWLIGIIDLLLYVFRQPSFLHWFNDILLIFGGAILMGTIILMDNDY